MSEAAGEVVVDDVVEDVVEEQEYSEVELKALDMGWNPEGVEGKEHIEAGEFVRRQELFDRIHALEKGINKQKDANEALAEHAEMIRDMQKEKYEEQIASLKSQRKEAMQDMDYDKVDQLEDKIDAAKDKLKEADKPVEQPEVDVQEIKGKLDSWAEKNTWYNDNRVMKAFAESEANAYWAKNPNSSIEDALAYVEAETRKEFPSEFGNKSKTRPSTVESGGKPARGTKRYTVKDLPPEVVKVMNRIVGTTSRFPDEQSYVDSYFKE